MTDYDVYGKNKITGFALRMTVKNIEHFSPEIQQAFKELANAVEYPKQSTLEEYDGGTNEKK